ncbi:RND family efflux transporter MFP subunit [Methylovorus glucosotrophus]|uniref:efflux RND transporter periplasmic adaptor subunit n=1 Tax=Methylovorus glucosotrophus TaxID=266009 RepID=UPI0013315894|nr:efflux RND transporter periplasmic adaptor subunit [Methylovorus glucosotrophus]KAF0843498.1 RND family efflux transporter MFP subunit [Methylovorus glucosotrophus]
MKNRAPYVSLALLLTTALLTACHPSKSGSEAGETKPALTVRLVSPQETAAATSITANGNILAWQEAIIGNEVSGLRLKAVYVNVGNKVKKGQLLAEFDDETVKADLAQKEADALEAEANLRQAELDANRVKGLAKGALSEQQIVQYLTTEQTAKAKFESAVAALESQRLRLRRTRIVAPEFGTISSRTATVGSVVNAGEELFRLVMQDRLEWRGEVGATELASVKPGQAVTLTPTGSQAQVTGKVRVIAPTMNQDTRNTLVYVDIPQGVDGPLKSGMFARGSFAVGEQRGLSLPSSAVLNRDGYEYVFTLSDQQHVERRKVVSGGHVGDRIIIREGIDPKARYVESGVGFLIDGDIVRVAQ